MLAQRKRICGKVREQNLNWGLQNWLSTVQRSPFFRHHFSKSTLNSALFPRLLCVGRMRVDMTMYGEGLAVRVATPSRSFTTSWASSSDNPQTPRQHQRYHCQEWQCQNFSTSSQLVLQILPFSPCTTCNSQASCRNWLWWWWWRWVTGALPHWRLVKRSWANKKEKKNLSSVGRSCRNQQLANSLIFFVVAELHVSLKDTPPKKAAAFCKKKKKKTQNDGFIHFISLHIFYEDCRKVTYILVKAALLRGYLYQVSGKEDKGDGGNK